jgi:autotransporter-associated beta strand protein
LTKKGAGRLTLAAANTFNGDTTVNGGTLALNHGLALQNSTLDTNAAGTVDLSALTSGTLGGIRGAGSLGIVVASPVSLSVGNNHTDTTFSGSIPAGINALSKIGSGSLTLTGTIVAAGAGSVDAGMLVVGGSLQANSLNVNGAARISGSGVLDSVGESFLYASSASSEFAGSVVGAQALEVSNGILTLSGSNTFSGGTAVYSTGVLVLNAAEAILDGTSLTVGDAGAFAPIVPDAAIAPREAVGPPVAAVPESGTLGLLLAGAAVLWWWRSRRFAGRP